MSRFTDRALMRACRCTCKKKAVHHDAAHPAASGTSASAGQGSVANQQHQPDDLEPAGRRPVRANTGAVGANAALVAQVGNNAHSNGNLQYGTPVNYSGYYASAPPSSRLACPASGDAAPHGFALAAASG